MFACLSCKHTMRTPLLINVLTFLYIYWWNFFITKCNFYTVSSCQILLNSFIFCVSPPNPYSRLWSNSCCGGWGGSVFHALALHVLHLLRALALMFVIYFSCSNLKTFYFLPATVHRSSLFTPLGCFLLLSILAILFLLEEERTWGFLLPKTSTRLLLEHNIEMHFCCLSEIPLDFVFVLHPVTVDSNLANAFAPWKGEASLAQSNTWKAK